MLKKRMHVLCMALVTTSYVYTMDPTSPTHLHQDSGGQGLRRDTNHAIAPEERRRMEEVAQPLSLQDLAHLKWPMRRYHASSNDYWFLDELLRDPIAKRLAVSTQEVKERALCAACDFDTNEQKYQKGSCHELDTVEKRYKAACCIAVGAREWLPSIFRKAVLANMVNFVATLEPFKPDPNVPVMIGRSEREACPVGGEYVCNFTSDVPLFFFAETRKMAKWMWILHADYEKKGSKDKGTVLHWLCTCPPQDTKQAVKLLSFYLDKGVDPKALDIQGRTALHCVARNPMANSWFHEYASPFAEKLLEAGVDAEHKDRDDKTYMDHLKGNVALREKNSSPAQYDKYLKYHENAGAKSSNEK